MLELEVSKQKPNFHDLPANRDGLAAWLQRTRPRGAAGSAHRWPPPFCPESHPRSAQRSAQPSKKQLRRPSLAPTRNPAGR